MKFKTQVIFKSTCSLEKMSYSRWDSTNKLFFDEEDFAKFSVPTTSRTTDNLQLSAQRTSSGIPDFEVTSCANTEFPDMSQSCPDASFLRTAIGISTPRLSPHFSVTAPEFVPRFSQQRQPGPILGSGNSTVDAQATMTSLTLTPANVTSKPTYSLGQSVLEAPSPEFVPGRASLSMHADATQVSLAYQDARSRYSLPRVTDSSPQISCQATLQPDQYDTTGLLAARGMGSSQPMTCMANPADASIQLQNLCSLLAVNARLSRPDVQGHSVTPRPWPPSGSNAAPSSAFYGAQEVACCQFCRRNGEHRSVYTSHALKDQNNNVVCPVLRRYVCPICGETGSSAHTVSYCPQGRGVRTVIATPRKSCGCVRKCVHSESWHH